MNVMLICVRITPPVWMTSINTSVTVCLVTLAHSVKRRSMSVIQGRCVTLHSKIQLSLFPRPCIHAVSCEDRINDYTCNCLKGYSGKNCDHCEEPSDCNLSDGETTIIILYTSNIYL